LPRPNVRHVDLDVVDEISVPDRLEQSIGETECENILRRFLAEEMVDSEDLVFVEHFVQSAVQRNRARKIGAERLFHDDAGPLDQAGLAEQAHRGQGRIRRHAEVVEPAAFAVEDPFGLQYRCPERFGACGHRYELQAIRERSPVRVVHVAGRELGERFSSEVAEALGIEIIQRCADNSASGNKSRTRQMKHAGQQFAPRQVARRAHQHDDLRKLRTHTGRYLCHHSHPIRR
jgi:hypothetical protein